MRHVFASRPVSARALGMPEPSPAAGLVSGARRALATPPRMRAAISGAVNLAAIATTANQRLDPTAGAQKQSGRSSVVMIGLAAAIWTRARLSAILIGHACLARCGARRRAEPPSLDRRRACPRKGQAYPNIRPSVRATSPQCRRINLCHAQSSSRQPRESAAKLTTTPSRHGFSKPSTSMIVSGKTSMFSFLT